MTDGKLLVEKLLRYATNFLHLDPLDVIYTRNLLLREFKLKEPFNSALDVSAIECVDTLSVPDTLVAETEAYALENSLVEDGYQGLYSTYIMGLLSPLPSKVNEQFNAIRQSQGIEKACEYFYGLCIKNNYIQKTAISKNLKWEYKDGVNILEITINLSKPEKDNKDIAKLLSAPKKLNYPACLLCKENEGFEGTLNHPARENIRTVSLTLGGEEWFVQYSPYAYYDEHCIAISKNHTPMKVQRSTVEKLLDFVDVFPNYMIGSNASLPIIGGSILNHEHFQGGVHLMPMHKAPFKRKFKSKEYPSVEIGIVDWYNSVVRLNSSDRGQIAALAGDIIDSWKDYIDGACDIFASTESVSHNSLSPVCRKLHDGRYSLDLILRNNRTSEEFPDGIFHAHPEYHNIKKEGIGLIEAMGLFILPGRLKKQLDMIADILCGNASYNQSELEDSSHILHVHKAMIEDMIKHTKAKNKTQAKAEVTARVNSVCKNILGNTAVFKNDENGRAGFKQFLNFNNITEE